MRRVVVYHSDGNQLESLKLANRLRNLGYKVEIQMQDKKLKKSLDYANKENIPYVIVLGENEVQSNTFKIKNMNNGVEKSISFPNLENILEFTSKK